MLNFTDLALPSFTDNKKMGNRPLLYEQIYCFKNHSSHPAWESHGTFEHSTQRREISYFSFELGRDGLRTQLHQLPAEAPIGQTLKVVQQKLLMIHE